MLSQGDILQFDLALLKKPFNQNSEDYRSWRPKPLDNLHIIFEDHHLIVINKPKNLIVHPGYSVKHTTLIEGIIYYLKQNNKTNNNYLHNLPPRYGVIHRLDKDTSGCMLFAKTTQAYHHLLSQFTSNTFSRTYLALLDGVLPYQNFSYNSYIYRSKINRKSFESLSLEQYNLKKNHSILQNFNKLRFAKSTFIQRITFGKYDLAQIKLATGRTHQIRVHALAINKPVVGDLVYLKKDKTQTTKKFFSSLQINPHSYSSQLLHARNISFIHPITHKQISISAPLDQGFIDVLNKLKSLI